MRDVFAAHLVQRTRPTEYLNPTRWRGAVCEHPPDVADKLYRALAVHYSRRESFDNIESVTSIVSLFAEYHP